MKRLFLPIIMLFFVLGSYAQLDLEIEDEIKIETDGNKITITIEDDRAGVYDLLIYKSYEEIMMNEYELTDNPVTVDITGWEPGVYHIKVDYAHITQFRHYEILE
ncbi:MAG: hypothetical protein C0592_08270 [Marinilabiliales bacterium]|nr:MAG: hypothetical protein C0592_08270 [Marinilabiliales bacterium]